MKKLANIGKVRLEELLDVATLDSISASNSAQVEKLEYLFSVSDFIFRTCSRQPDLLDQLLTSATPFEVPSWQLPDEQWIAMSEAEAMKTLRHYRNQLMVIIAARHFLKTDSIKKCMRDLSQAADLFFGLARQWAEASLLPRWGRALDENSNPVAMIALGMGKLGGYELNFSSDIDLIFCYSEKGITEGGRNAEDFQTYFTKLAQKVIHLLDTVTPDGQVYRVDMRLRPFGDSGPLVSSFASIENYYQDHGRDWERYALLKARPLAHPNYTSQVEYSQQHTLIEMLRPFVFRRYIDFSVIESLRTMKSQIKSEVKRRNLTNNIKLGAGGIREAEFIVQALQMLRGGKEPQLQQSSFLVVLPELTRLKVFTKAESQLIEQSYLWLRECEQYLQAFDDKQTQTLPMDDLNQQRLLHLFEFESWSELLLKVEQVTKQVHHVFNEVIGDDPDAQTIKPSPLLKKWRHYWLTEIQSTPSESNAFEESEHFLVLLACLFDNKKELIKSVLSSKGRDKLDLLIPVLMAECERQNIAEHQCKSILNIIRKIATRTTYLSLLGENPGALTQLVSLVSSCDFIGQELRNFPMLLDQLIDPKLLYSVPLIKDYAPDLRRNLLRVAPDDLELQMEILRQFKLSSQMIIAACDVKKIIDVPTVSGHLTILAEVILDQVVNIAWRQMIDRYGYPAGASDENKNFAVLGYGKLGGYELGYGSDLDVVFVHDCASSAPTDGAKQIDSRQFYLKLVQRILHIFTTRTATGVLYDVDTRLRPSGASGLLAININTYKEYQHTEAWTWEHQALVRARAVKGSVHIKEKFDEIRKSVLLLKRDPEVLKSDISTMRQKMMDNLGRGTTSLFDIKQSRGGVADIEFIAQYLVLNYSHQHPSLAEFSDNRSLLTLFTQFDILSKQQAKHLWGAYEDYRALYHQATLNAQVKLIDYGVEVDGRSVKELSDAVHRIWTWLGLQ